MNKKLQIALTGDRPTGKLHLGHLIGSIENRVKLQNEADKSFYMIADMQALTDNAENPEKVRSNMIEVVLDNLACGVDPEKTTFFIQSQIPEISHLALIFMNLVTVARLKRNPTVKNEMKQKGYDEDVPLGFLAYPISQTADILFAKANTIPVGEDQLPVIEQANEILHKFNTLYGETFEKIEAVVSSTPRLVGVDGKAKMSKSLGNTIFISDTKEEIEKKVMSMYTDPKHLRVEDPGEVEGNIVFTYLDIFAKDKKEIEEMKEHYRKGGLGDVVLKKKLIEILEETLAPIREKRKILESEKDKIIKILEEGTQKARLIAQETLKEVLSKMSIVYY